MFDNWDLVYLAIGLLAVIATIIENIINKHKKDKPDHIYIKNMKELIKETKNEDIQNNLSDQRK